MSPDRLQKCLENMGKYHDLWGRGICFNMYTQLVIPFARVRWHPVYWRIRDSHLQLQLLQQVLHDTTVVLQNEDPKRRLYAKENRARKLL